MKSFRSPGPVRGVVALVVSILGVQLLVVPVAAADDAVPGAVVGSVTDEAGGPLGDVCVSAQVAVEWGFEWVAGTATGPDGTYRLEGVPAGEVRVRFESCGAGPLVAQWYPGSADVEGSVPVVVTAGADVTGIDATMVEGITVSGTVRDPDGEPIEQIGVWVDGGTGAAGAWAVTDVDGRYTTTGLPPGSYRVEFRDTSRDPVWARTFWGGAVTEDDADVLVLTDDDRPNRSDVDVVLVPGATVTGTVVDATGSAVAGVCVGIIADDGDRLRGIGWASTDDEGVYRVGGLPAVPVWVRFEVCDPDPTLLPQWFDGVSFLEEATRLDLEAGSTTSGVDAVLAPAGVVAGVVTDPSGTPLQGICVEVAGDDRFGGSDRTGADGSFVVAVSTSGSYRAQFVDCSDEPLFAGRYWDGGAHTGDARRFEVELGGTTTLSSTVLTPGEPATVEVTARTVDLRAVTTACAVVFLPDEFVRFEPIGPDGRATFEGMPSGTFATAVVGCDGEGEPEPLIPDPDHPEFSYPAVWGGGASLAIPGYEAPDPFAQGAELLTVGGGGAGEVAFCLGCDALGVSAGPVTDGSVDLHVEVVGVQFQGVGTMGSPVEYLATCSPTTSDHGAVTVTGDFSPLRVDGLEPATSYDCSVVATVSGDVVGGSNVVQVTAPAAESSGPPAGAGATGPGRVGGDPVGGDTAAPGSAGAPQEASRSDAVPAAATGAPAGARPGAPAPGAAGVAAPGALALTGADAALLLLAAALLVAVGAGLVAGARRRRHPV